MTSSQNLSLWLVFPHQLFDQLPEGVETVAVMEEPLFFEQYVFHIAAISVGKTQNPRNNVLMRCVPFDLATDVGNFFQQEWKVCIEV